MRYSPTERQLSIRLTAGWMNSRIYYRCQMTGMDNNEKSLWAILVIIEMGFSLKNG